MTKRHTAIGIAVLALATLGAVAHHSSTARASQVPAVAPATPMSGSYLDPVAPAAMPVAPGLAAPTSGGPATSAALASAGSAVATPVATAPVPERVVYRDRVVYRTVRARPRTYVHRRSKKHSAMIIGGSAVGGAGIGALVGGKKGALIGGLVGGTAGTVYDRTTKKKVTRE